MSDTAFNEHSVAHVQQQSERVAPGNARALLALLRFQSLAEGILSRFGMSIRRWHALLLLHLHGRNGEMTVTELSLKLAIQPNTSTELVKRMEADGLVERRRSEEDQRIVKVCITPEGRSLLQEVALAGSGELAEVSGELREVLVEEADAPLPDSV